MRDPEPCLNANRNDKAKRSDCRSDVFKKMRDDLITEHRIHLSSRFDRNGDRIFEHRYRKVGDLRVER